MKYILIVSAVFPPEPVFSASLASDLAEELSKYNYLKVLTPRPSRPLGYEFRPNILVKKNFDRVIVDSYTYPKSKLLGRMIESYSFGKYVARFIKNNRNEINCIYVNAWPLIAQFIVTRSSEKFRIPVVMHIQDIYPESLINKIKIFNRLIINLLLPIDRYTLKKSTKVVTISESMKEYLIRTRHIQESKTELVFNWTSGNNTDLLESNDTLKKSSQNFNFLFLGSLSPTAGIDILIQAFQKINNPNFKFTIAGSGSEKEYLTRVGRLNKKAQIEFINAHPDDVLRIQSEADVLLLSLKKGASKYALPSKLMSYMFSRKPIIAFVDKEGDVARIIIQSNCGWVVPIEDFDGLVDTIISVSNLPREELLFFGCNGYNFATTYFTKEANLKKLIKIIKGVI